MTRWHCAYTHHQQERMAEWSLLALGFETFFPLHLDPGRGPHPVPRISPAFTGYILIAFDPSRDQWRRLLRARGIAGIIGAPDRPTPIPHGVVEELQARTSARRIIDDPGAAPPAQAPSRASHWADITRLSPRARSELLLRLFGREDVAA